MFSNLLLLFRQHNFLYEQQLGTVRNGISERGDNFFFLAGGRSFSFLYLGVLLPLWDVISRFNTLGYLVSDFE